MSKIMMNKRYGLEDATIEGYKTKTSRVEKCLSVLPTDYDKLTTQIEICPYDTATKTIVAKRIWNDCHVETYHLKPRYKVDEVVALAQCYKDAINPLDWVNTLIYKDKIGWKNKMFVREDMMLHHILISNVELRRLWDFSNGDCIDEGIKGGRFNDFPYTMYFPYPGCKDSEVCYTPKGAFKILFDKINGRGAHDKNPWVFVYSFFKMD